MALIEHVPLLPYPSGLKEILKVETYLQSLYRALHDFFQQGSQDMQTGVYNTELDDLKNTDLADPGADKIVFWDDSDGEFKFLVANDFLTIATNNLNVDVLDEDDMASDSAIHLATQQSIKAYVGSGGVGGYDSEDAILAGQVFGS